VICLDKCLLLKSDLDDIGALGVGNSGDDNRALGDHRGRGLGHNILCNKTVVNIVDSVHSDRTGNLSPP
jgi:hypothetical protein